MLKLACVCSSKINQGAISIRDKDAVVNVKVDQPQIQTAQIDSSSRGDQYYMKNRKVRLFKFN